MRSEQLELPDGKRTKKGKGHRVVTRDNQVAIIYFFCLLALSIGIVFSPYIAVAFMAILVCCTGLIIYPKHFLLIFGFFIVSQCYIVAQLGRDTFLGTVVLRVDEMFILLSFVILFLKTMIYEDYGWRKTAIDAPLLCLIGASILSTLVANIVPWKHSMFDLFMLLKGFMIFYIFTFVPFKEKDIRFYTKVFLILGLFVLVVGCIDLSLGVTFKSVLYKKVFIDEREGILSVSSIWSHPGKFGWFMAYLACFAFAFDIVFKKKRYLFFAVLFTIGVLLSMRIKPIGGLIVALLCGYLTVRQGVLKTSVKLALIAVIVGIFFGEEIISLFNEKIVVYVRATDPLSVARSALYITSGRIAVDYLPFGSGLGTFGGWIAQLYYSPLYYKYGLSSVHGLSQKGNFLCDTFWPYVLGQFGIIGLLSYLWIVWRIIKMILHSIRISQSLFLKAYSLGVLMIIVEGLIESSASAIFLTSPQIYFIFSALGILHSSLNQRGNYDKSQDY